MKIDRSTDAKGVNGAYRATQPRTPVPAAGPAPAAPADKVGVSEKARQAASLKQMLQSAPEVRLELVERIKAQIAAGEYSVSPRDVADKLLKSKVLDE